ncbi:thiaminase II [Dyadobacter tibetensis]|uniref:thiaminase II n=1 Tax=Dyadobacter tibetensis TaxID=1211851 RepID=UPI000471A4D4|nr:thiaminase II [Dyadobacter tibetensis]
MKFTDSLWEENTPIFDKIIAHPFIQELKDGSLKTDQFTFYIYQDSLYLHQFSKALAVTGTKTQEADSLLAFLGFAQNAILVERALHDTYFKEYAINRTDGMSPTAFSYTQYLLATANYSSYAISVAALLPCFWIYQRVGNYIVGESAGNNPYQSWIDTYSGEEFAQAVTRMLGLCENLGQQASPEERKEMQVAFTRACQLEYMFWDSAYKMEKWPV